MVNGVAKGYQCQGASPTDRKRYRDEDGKYRKINAKKMPSRASRACRATSAERKAVQDAFAKADPVSKSEERRRELSLLELAKDWGAENSKFTDLVDAMNAAEKPKRRDYINQLEGSRKSSRFEEVISSMKSLSMEDKSD